MIGNGRPIADVARDFEIDEGLLGKWVDQWKASNPDPEVALSPVE